MGSSTGDMLMDDSDTMETLFREAPCLIAAHCEDEAIIRKNTGLYKAGIEAGTIVPDASIHPRIRTVEACKAATMKAVNLALKTGARLHILHVSTADELSLLQDDTPLERKKITAETCPHYLYFDDGSYDAKSYRIKCNPAIKTSRDRMMLLKALNTGKIDTIGTDHAPHLLTEKMTGDCFTSKSGFPSIQHSFEIMYGLSREGHLAITDIVRLMCHNPAALYRIDRRGFIREGYHADLAIVEPEESGRTIGDDTELTGCGWSPYEGTRVQARVTHTFVNGKLVYKNGTFDENSRGERLLFNR